MKRKILFVSLFVLVLLLFPHAQASAQTPPFPQVNQNWSYNITGNADWDAPVDATIGFTATARYTVVNTLPGEMQLRQEVIGNPIWPTTTGSGEINYYNLDTATETPETTNSSFAFVTTGVVDLDTSDVSSISGDEYSSVHLEWTEGSDTVGAYVGLHTWLWFIAFFPFPAPPLFFTDTFQTMFYWNTSYEPWTTTPTTTYWNVESVATALGVRNAYRNTTATSFSIATIGGATTLDTWIDFDSGILLKQTCTTAIDNDGVYDCQMTTNIDIASCDFFGILGTLFYLKIAGIPLLYILIAAIVILLIVLLLVCYLTRRNK